MAKRGRNSIKSSRRWGKKGVKGITALVVGPKFKGMGKSNLRRLSKKFKKFIYEQENLDEEFVLIVDKYFFDIIDEE